MVSAAVLQRIQSDSPGMEIVRLEADNGETFETLFPVHGAFFQPNRASAASDSWGVTFTPGEAQVTITLAGTTTNVTGTLVCHGI